MIGIRKYLTILRIPTRMFHLSSTEMKATIVFLLGFCFIATFLLRFVRSPLVIVPVIALWIAIQRRLARGPVAAEVLCGTQHLSSLKGKTVIITGANTGIGFATAKEMAKYGAIVVLACRDEAGAKDSIRCITAEYPTADVRFIHALSLESFSSIRSFVCAFLKLKLPLDILVHNAGVAMPEFTEAACGYELQIATHFLGPLLLTLLLEPLLVSTSNSRVVFVSSSAHLRTRIHLQPARQLLVLRRANGRAFFTQDWLAIYGLSKLCELYAAQQLNVHFHERNPKDPCKVVAVHPGIVFTKLFRHLWGWWWRWPLYYWSLCVFRTPYEAAQTVLHAAVDPRAVGGEYYIDCKNGGEGAQQGKCMLSLWARDQEQSAVVYNWGLQQVAEGVAESAAAKQKEI